MTGYPGRVTGKKGACWAHMWLFSACRSHMWLHGVRACDILHNLAVAYVPCACAASGQVHAEAHRTLLSFACYKQVGFLCLATILGRARTELHITLLTGACMAVNKLDVPCWGDTEVTGHHPLAPECCSGTASPPSQFPLSRTLF